MQLAWPGKEEQITYNSIKTLYFFKGNRYRFLRSFRILLILFAGKGSKTTQIIRQHLHRSFDGSKGVAHFMSNASRHFTERCQAVKAPFLLFQTVHRSYSSESR